jgi:hypothetical protein
MPLCLGKWSTWKTIIIQTTSPWYPISVLKVTAATATETLVPCCCQIKSLEGRSNLPVLRFIINHHPSVFKKTTTPTSTWIRAPPNLFVKSSPRCRAGPHVTPMRLSKSNRRIPPSSNLFWTEPTRLPPSPHCRLNRPGPPPPRANWNPPCSRSDSCATRSGH